MRCLALSFSGKKLSDKSYKFCCLSRLWGLDRILEPKCVLLIVYVVLLLPAAACKQRNGIEHDFVILSRFLFRETDDHLRCPISTHHQVKYQWSVSDFVLGCAVLRFLWEKAAEKNGITFIRIYFILRIQWLSQNLKLKNSCICTRRDLEDLCGVLEDLFALLIKMI